MPMEEHPGMDAQVNTARTTESLESCIRARHSVRIYKPDLVDEDVLRDCLKLAQLAPSNSNIENWRLTFAHGPARQRIAAALKNAALAGPPCIPTLPEQFIIHRSTMGHSLYGESGYDIPRGDKARMNEARMRNYDFFGAPTIGLITMDKHLTSVDAMSVGMFVQTFMLALTERGLGACLEVSVTGYPDILQEQFELDEDQLILCGIAIGWPADHNINRMHMEREPLESEIRILSN